MSPDSRSAADRKYLKDSLGDDAELDVGVVCGDLPLDLVPIPRWLAVEMLVA